MGKPFYYLSKCIYSLGRPMYPTKVIGRENIVKSGKCIYACNHLSAVDIPLTQVHIPGYRRYIGKKDFTEKKFSKFLLAKFGVIFIDRDKPELSVMREIFKVLDNGQILIFPEGTRNKGDEKEMLRDICYFLSGEPDVLEGVQCCGLGGCAGVKEPELAGKMPQGLEDSKSFFTYCASCSGSLTRKGYRNASHILPEILGRTERPDVSPF